MSDKQRLRNSFTAALRRGLKNGKTKEEVRAAWLASHPDGAEYVDTPVRGRPSGSGKPTSKPARKPASKPGRKPASKPGRKPVKKTKSDLEDARVARNAKSCALRALRKSEENDDLLQSDVNADPALLKKQHKLIDECLGRQQSRHERRGDINRSLGLMSKLFTNHGTYEEVVYRKPKNAYLFYVDSRSADRTKNIGEDAKMFGADWRAMSASAKTPFVRQAEAAKRAKVVKFNVGDLRPKWHGINMAIVGSNLEHANKGDKTAISKIMRQYDNYIAWKEGTVKGARNGRTRATTRAPSEYNIFVKKYFQDNEGVTLADAAAAWQSQKSGGSPAGRRSMARHSLRQMSRGGRRSMDHSEQRSGRRSMDHSEQRSGRRSMDRSEQLGGRRSMDRSEQLGGGKFSVEGAREALNKYYANKAEQSRRSEQRGGGKFSVEDAREALNKYYANKAAQSRRSEQRGGGGYALW